MTAVVAVAAGSAGVVVGICVAALMAAAARNDPGGDDTDRAYWQGFADGETHAHLNERTPSAN